MFNSRFSSDRMRIENRELNIAQIWFLTIHIYFPNHEKTHTACAVGYGSFARLTNESGVRHPRADIDRWHRRAGREECGDWDRERTDSWPRAPRAGSHSLQR